MYTKTLLIVFLFVAAPFININGQTKDNKQIKITYGLFMKKVVPNFKEGTFYAEFYWWTKFKNDSSITGWSNEEITNLEYVNACQSEIEGATSEIQETKIIGENEFYYTGYHQGDFYFNPDYRSYPFDVQILNITIENSLIPSDELIFEIDTTSFLNSKADRKFFGLSNDLLKNRNTNFNISKSDITTTTGIYNSNFGDPEFPNESVYSRINTAIYIDRSFAPFITKLIIPLAIILFLVYFVFYIPADKIDIAAGLTVTSLLSAIAFQLSVNSDLPEIGYMIYVDKVFYSCYFLISISMAESLYTFYLDKSGDERKMKLAVNIDKISRFLFPIVFVLSIWLFA
jgi:hypothetical protein